MITTTIKGKLADIIAIKPCVEHPRTPDEVLFAHYWADAQVRRYGKGYRVTLTAPAWVHNWIADEATQVLEPGTDVTEAEIKAAEEFMAQMRATGQRNAYDGPTKAELVEAGLVEAPKEEEKTVETVTPKGIRFEASPEGAEAEAAYKRLQEERLAVPAADVKKGDHIRPEPKGPWFPVTADAHASRQRGHVFIMSGQHVITRPAGSRVLRHDRAECARIMYDVAAQYPGATVDLPEEPKEESKVEETPVPDLTEAQAKALVDTYLGAEVVEYGKRNHQRMEPGKMHQGAGHSKTTMERLEAHGLITMEWHVTQMIGVKTERHWTADITDRGRAAIARTTYRFLGPDGERFEMDLVAIKDGLALLTASDWEDGPDAEPVLTKTWYPKPWEALSFIGTTTEELEADGWTRQAD